MFYLVFTVLILAELIKGLSANGTPPVLQNYTWQLNLAYFMWSSIAYIRVLLATALAFLVWQMPPSERPSILFAGVIFSAVWAFVYWLFNLFWAGKYKFDPLKKPTFPDADSNGYSVRSSHRRGLEWR